MFGVGLGLVLLGGVAAFVYLVRERLGAPGAGMAALRTAAFALLLVLLANPVRERPGDEGPATVLLDASLSLGAAGGQWDLARDSALALAGTEGRVFRIGYDVEPFDSTPPRAGVSRAGPGLQAAAARGGPVYLVTDGELQDYAAIPSALRDHVSVVLLPRDTVPNVSLLEVAVPDRVRTQDSIPMTLEIATWGDLAADRAALVIRAGRSVILRETIALPPPPGVARRAVHIPRGALGAGTHVLDVAVTASGDQEPGDDGRTRVIMVSELPAIVLIARPADWESRFLMRELAAVTRATVRGFAEIAPGRWLDMRSLEPVRTDEVRRAADEAALLVTRGTWTSTRRRQPRWTWPTATREVTVATGDWYPVGEIPASPLAGPLGGVEWDSLPPLTGIVPMAPAPGEWTALSARLGRRGAERPAIVGHDSARVRTMTTAADGLWRWALRGGASREAYRAVLAAGVDWLLGIAGGTARGPMVATDVVPRGVPVTFRWVEAGPPGDLTVRLAGADSTVERPLRFDTDGVASVRLEPGVYRWQVPGTAASGLAVVESYSEELHPGAVAAQTIRGASAMSLLLVNARDQWWAFALVIVALVGEWAWRTRRGLP